MSSQRIGDLLAGFFDEKTLQKAGAYSKLFSSWEQLTGKYGLSQAAAHSRIADLERGILRVEADHPGWIQLLQTKQRELLDGVRSLFTDLEIRGISFRLMKSGSPDFKPTGQNSPLEQGKEEDTGGAEEPAAPQTRETAGDELFKESLQRLKRSIEAKNR
jgi:hypothetical protein